MSRPWVLIAAFAAVTVMLLAGFAMIPAGTAAAGAAKLPALTLAGAVSAAQPVATTVAAAGSPLLNAAVSSLDRGAGPAFGIPAQCAVSAAGQAACGAPPIRSPGTHAPVSHSSAAHSAAPGGTPQFYNVTPAISTASLGAIPTVEFSGRMAYDPLLNEVVLFNGCSTSLCNSNSTWTYNGFAWDNITASLALSPSARQGAGMDYDPGFDGVILYAGTNTLGFNMDDTWLFNATGWYNITATVGAPLAGGTEAVTWAYGAMTYDPAIGSMIVVDGCVDAACDDVWGQTFYLNATGWGWSWGPGTLDNRTYLAYNSLAYDAADGYLVEFGGYDYFSAMVQNYTYWLNSTSGNWMNITNMDAGCVAGTCYTPPARDSAAMTWDSQLNAVLLMDGFNYTTGTWYNDSWLFSGGVWLPANLTGTNAPSNYCGAAQPALAEVSDNVAPFIIGGAGPCGSAGETNEFVYEVAPLPTLAATPNPLDLGMTTTAAAGWAIGTGSGIVAAWNVSYGDGHFVSAARGATTNTSQAFSHAFPAHTYGSAAVFVANVTWTDFFYITGTASVTVTVHPAVAATITASALTITAGNAVTFTTSPTGGSGTYTYAWSFGDATTSTVQDPAAHTFAKAGTYVVNLTVTDSIGQAVHATSVTITVNAAPSSFSLGSTGTYLVIGLVLLVVVVLAVVLLMRRRKKPAPSAQPWQSGTPPAGAGAPPPGASGVPPGAAESPPPPPPAP